MRRTFTPYLHGECPIRAASRIVEDHSALETSVLGKFLERTFAWALVALVGKGLPAERELDGLLRRWLADRLRSLQLAGAV